MGFTSHDDLLNQVSSNGKYMQIEMAKNTTPAHTSGGWHLLAGLAGSPIASTFPGTTLQWCSTDENSGDGTNLFAPWTGGAPGGTATKHIINAGASIIGAAGAPWILKLVDLQGYYPMRTTDVTGTGSRTLINTNTFTANAGTDIITYTNDFVSGTKVRFTTTTTLPAGLSLATDYWLVRQSSTTAKVATSYANYVAGTTVDITDAGTGTHTLTIQMPRYDSGVGCQAAFVSVTAPATGGPTVSASSYTNSAGATGRAFTGTPTMNAAADAYAGRVLHSGNAAGRYGPFLPLAGGDKGIAKIDSFTWSAGTAYTGTGVVALCIMKPLLTLPSSITGQWNERDLVNQLMSLPQVKDGANLQWMLFGTGGTTNLSIVTSTLDVGWGG
jgi:hypothetical protein